MVIDEAVEPTCTATGLTEGSHCSRCDDATTAQTVVAALGHSFTNYVSDGNATCLEDGTKTAKCDRCDATDTKADEDSALGHSFTNYVSDGNATCTADGTKTAKCDRCDATDTKADEDSALGHSFTNYVSDGNATCTADGTKTAKCDRCDATDTKADEGTVLGHSFKNYVSDGNATCTADGTKTAKCDRCDATDTVADEGSALGHAYVGAVTKEATCTEKGVMTYTCSNDASHTYTEDIALKAHNIVNVDAKAPTCEEAGFKAYEYCTTCSYTTFEPVAATGHSYNSGVITTEPTCEGTGVKTFTCQNDASHTYTEEVAATGHDYDMTKSEANLTRPVKNSDGTWEDGYYTFTCKNDASHKTTEEVKRADYSEYDELLQDADTILGSDIPEEDKAKLEDVLNDNKIPADLIESEQGQIEDVLDEIRDVIAEVYPDAGLTLEIRGNNTFYAGTILDLEAVKVGGSVEITATDVQWTSSDDNIVFFSNGKLFAIGTGTVTLTAKTGILTASKTVTIVEGGNARKLNFLAIDKMHFIVEDYFAIFNGANLYWSNDYSIRFRVYTYQSFPFETYIVYINGQAVEPDADGYYTVPSNAGDIRVTISGAVYDDDGSGNASKFNFWEWLLAFFRKIINFFKNLFGIK